jgi:PAS domain S-box-containing protein
MRWTRWTRWAVLLSLIFIIVSLIYLVTLRFSTDDSFAESNKWVIHTYEVINNLDVLLSTLEEAETTQRGYLITGRPDHLELYNAALEKIDILTRASRTMTADNESQQRNFDLLEPLIAQKLNKLAETMNTRRDSGFEAARAIVLTNIGKAVMDKIRVLVADMQAQERQLLSARNIKAKVAFNNLTYVFIAICCLIVLLILLSGTLLFQEILDRKRAEDRLVSANEDLQEQAALLDLSHDAIFVVDSADVVSFWNKGAEDLYGFTREQAIGNVAYELIKTKFPESFEHVVNLAIDTGYWAGELRQTTSSGEELVIESRWALQRGENGEPTGFLETNRDITARKLAEEALRSSMASLELVNAELREFAYVASHDLQEPLRAVSSYVQLLAQRYKGRLDQDADDFIFYAQDGASRMQRLIEDLLAYSRVGTRKDPFARIDCEAVLKETLLNLQLAVEDSGARVSHDPLPTVAADRFQLVQLLQNLLSNAIKFRGESSPIIHIGVEKRNREWLFSVRDNGLGIEEQYFQRIFQVFQRLHGRDEYSGTGIGLAICKKIVERHGGRIWVDSTPGTGATFYFTIPVIRG